MRTLYLRNIPDDVGKRLEALAAQTGMSVSAFAVRELSEIARRADNPGLRDHGVAAAEVVADVEAGRAAQ